MQSNLSPNFLSARAQLLLIGLLSAILDITMFRFLLARADGVANAPVAGAHLTSFMLAAVFGCLLALFGPLNRLAKVPRLNKSHLLAIRQAKIATNYYLVVAV